VDPNGPGRREHRDGRHRGGNLGTNYDSGEALITGWMANEDICANIMNPAFSVIGVGVFEPDDFDGQTHATSRTWTQYLSTVAR
jgi:uncharacterized protein YkwD